MMKITKIRFYLPFFVCFALVLASVGWAEAPLWAPGSPVASQPMMLRGIELDADNPLHFQFILDPGEATGDEAQVTDDSARLIKYFLAALTIPEKDMWVNLSPDEPDRIIADAFGDTEMGRDMLAEDYVLKHVSASLLHPEEETGRRFWTALGQAGLAAEQGADQVTPKVWIVPAEAQVYVDGPRVFVTRARLRVMMDGEYRGKTKPGSEGVSADHSGRGTVLRDVLVPALEHEVNEGPRFRRLRQIYHALILAAWYKRHLRQGILGARYVDQGLVAGVQFTDDEDTTKIYEGYLEALREGVYSLIREEYDAERGEVVPRKYFSGGVAMDMAMLTEDGTQNDLRSAVGPDARWVKIDTMVRPMGQGSGTVAHTRMAAGVEVRNVDFQGQTIYTTRTELSDQFLAALWRNHGFVSLRDGVGSEPYLETSEESPWPVMNSSLAAVDGHLDITRKIDALIADREASSEPEKPIVILDWGCGSGRTLKELAARYEDRKNLFFIGYGADMPRQWGEGTRPNVFLIWDQKEHFNILLRRILDVIGAEKVSLGFSHLGITHLFSSRGKASGQQDVIGYIRHDILDVFDDGAGLWLFPLSHLEQNNVDPRLFEAEGMTVTMVRVTKDPLLFKQLEGGLSSVRLTVKPTMPVAWDHNAVSLCDQLRDGLKNGRRPVLKYPDGRRLEIIEGITNSWAAEVFRGRLTDPRHPAAPKDVVVKFIVAAMEAPSQRMGARLRRLKEFFQAVQADPATRDFFAAPANLQTIEEDYRLARHFILDQASGESLERRGSSRAMRTQVIEFIHRLRDAQRRFGFIHGDLLPRNIMVDPRRGLRLIDWNEIALMQGSRVTSHAFEYWDPDDMMSDFGSLIDILGDQEMLTDPVPESWKDEMREWVARQGRTGTLADYWDAFEEVVLDGYLANEYRLNLTVADQAMLTEPQRIEVNGSKLFTTVPITGEDLRPDGVMTIERDHTGGVVFRHEDTTEWQETHTRLEDIERIIPVRALIDERIQKRVDEADPIVIVDLGCGAGIGLKELGEHYRRQGVRNLFFVGYSRDFFPEWIRTTESNVFFIWDDKESFVVNLKAVLREMGTDKADLAFSHLGISHRFDNVVFDSTRLPEALMDVRDVLDMIDDEAGFYIGTTDYFQSAAWPQGQIHQIFRRAGIDSRTFGVTGSGFEWDPQFGTGVRWQRRKGDSLLDQMMAGATPSLIEIEAREEGEFFSSDGVPRNPMRYEWTGGDIEEALRRGLMNGETPVLEYPDGRRLFVTGRVENLFDSIFTAVLFFDGQDREPERVFVVMGHGLSSAEGRPGDRLDEFFNDISDDPLVMSLFSQLKNRESLGADYRLSPHFLVDREKGIRGLGDVAGLGEPGAVMALGEFIKRLRYAEGRYGFAHQNLRLSNLIITARGEIRTIDSQDLVSKKNPADASSNLEVGDMDQVLGLLNAFHLVARPVQYQRWLKDVSLWLSQNHTGTDTRQVWRAFDEIVLKTMLYEDVQRYFFGDPAPVDRSARADASQARDVGGIDFDMTDVAIDETEGQAIDLMNWKDSLSRPLTGLAPVIIRVVPFDGFGGVLAEGKTK